MKKSQFTMAIISAILLIGLTTQARAADKKVKVFILAGQSNMEGHGSVRSLPVLGEHPEHGHLLKKLQNKDGSWAVRDDVTIAWKVKEKKHGSLTVGWGGEDNEIGPELMFGTIMGEKYDAPVLLIKTAWGGKDVYCDFRSPSAGKPTGAAAEVLKREREDGGNREIGQYYRMMIADAKETLGNIEDIVPGYQGQGYEIAGFAWFQGWNDFCGGHGVIEQYPKHLSAMFRDVRKDLGAPDMPIAIGELGIGGHEIAARAKKYEDDSEANRIVELRAAQKAVGEDPSLKNVTFVPTVDFWDVRLQELRKISDAWWGEKQKKGIKDTEENHLPTKEQNDEFLRRGVHWYCHYNGSSSNYSLIGYAMAEAINQSKRTVSQ
jgi:hypothetical protein